MYASNGSEMAALRTKKRLVGVIAIALILAFSVLAFARIFSFSEWLIGDLIVALVANLILRRLGKQT
jgi:hypothetical protein